MNKLLENNLYVRLIALFLAIILWLYVINEHSPQIQRTFVVPLEYRHLSSDLALVDKVATVDVKITGLNDNVLALNKEEIKAFVDLNATKDGQYDLPVNVDAPFNIKIVEIDPKKVKVVLQEIVSKKVPLVPQIKGTKLEKESVSGIVTDLKEVKVTGAQDAVGKTILALAVANISQISGSTQIAAKIVPVDELGQTVHEVQVEPEFTRVSISTLPLKQLPVIPTIIGKPAYGYRIKELTVVPNAVKVTGEDMAQLTSLKTMPIDVTDFNTNMQKEVELLVPQGVSVLENKTVKVLINLEEVFVEKHFTHLPIQVRNGAPSLSLDINPQQGGLTVVGEKVQLQGLKSSDFVLYVDGGLLHDEGIFYEELKVDLPSGLKVKGLEPIKVQVTVKQEDKS